MPRPKSLKPSYCHHKVSGRAFVTLDGRRVYLGKFGSQESKDRYDTEIAAWIPRGASLPPPLLRLTVPAPPPPPPSRWSSGRSGRTQNRTTFTPTAPPQVSRQR